MTDMDNFTVSIITDLNLNAISQVDSNQVVTLHSRVKLLQDFDVTLRVSEIQTAWLCGRQ